ncbi:BTAD domain-containing putative transcriptional regulator [Streptacidiphilus sp. P02-A3a]|uniref:AfsR/SARP family transcriptional regulator n=1 Tax=Streptacidiphilus sp. P02-A3a TaxID=2704468 RepID=UPI0015F8258A|nr:BTAD domain-containing putative transcriptional regulator [Streptacidiphilus sp. P02-A3a]QMU71278.1 tetratricopeptide repeat protein [Streptacidiphilus sp. P02-A3a]
MELLVDGRRVRLGSPKERALLAVLLCAAGTSVPVDVLLDRVWDGEPPPKGAETLQSYVSRLRNRLRTATGDLVRVDFSARAYRLVMEAENVDLLRFRHLHRKARVLSRTGDAEGAAELLREAETLWRGEALVEFTGDWATGLRNRLNEERRAVQELRVHLELGLGLHEELVGELTELAERSPAAEPVVMDLMLALFRSGRQGDALAVYRRARTRLRDELGLAPSIQLDTLHQRVLRGDADLLAVPTEPEPPGRPARPLFNLPRDIKDFTGRRAELGIILTAFGGEAPATLPLLVIHGMPGSGKSALATRAAHRLRDRYPDGVLFASIGRGYARQSPQHPSDALASLLALVGMPAQAMPPDLEGRASLWRERMAHSRTLLVLDDAHDAEQIRPLLPGTPSCGVIVTSRHWLAELEGSRSLYLDTLSESEAMELFTRIVGPARTADRVGVRRVTHLCGRLALALQISANRFRHQTAWSVQDLAERLAQPTGPRFGNHALRAVGSSFDLSYGELAEPERRLLRLLALHPGPDLTLRTATALDGRNAVEVGHSLEDLLDSHLLEESVKDRYLFHDLARDFALRVAEREETDKTLRAAISRLLDYYLAAADAADRLAYPGRRRLPLQLVGDPVCLPSLSDADEAGAWLDIERSNLLAVARAAVDRSPAHARLIPHVLAKSLYNWGSWKIAENLHAAALQAWEHQDNPVARAQIMVDRASALWALGSREDALHWGLEALALSRSAADPAGQAEALYQVARVRLTSDQPQEGLRYLDEALVLQRQAGNRRGQAEIANQYGVFLGETGKFQESLAQFRAMLLLEREIGDLHGQVWALSNTGEILLRLERYEAARARFEEALSLVRRIGGRQEMGILYENLGTALRGSGETVRSLVSHRRAARMFHDLRDLESEAESLISIGLTYQALGRNADALTSFTLAEQISQQIRSQSCRQRALLGIASAQRAAGSYLVALAAGREALELARRLGAVFEGAQALESLGEVVLALQGRALAASFWQRALVLYEGMAVPRAELLRHRLASLDYPSVI